MIKLALAAGLTLSIIGGFMALRGNIGGLFGGSSRDASPLSGIKSLLGLPGTSANSGSGGYLPPSDSSGSRYLPPASPTNRLRLQQDDSDADSTPAVFRIVLLSTTSTTASPSSSSSSTESTPTSTPVENVSPNDSEIVTPSPNTTTPSYLTSSTASITEEDPTTKPTTLPVTPIISPEVPRADFAGAGAGDFPSTTAEIIAKPYTTLQPPTSFMPSFSSSTSAPEKNISRPGYVLRPPPSLSEGLYLPPNL